MKVQVEQVVFKNVCLNHVAHSTTNSPTAPTSHLQNLLENLLFAPLLQSLSQLLNYYCFFFFDVRLDLNQSFSESLKPSLPTLLTLHRGKANMRLHPGKVSSVSWLELLTCFNCNCYNQASSTLKWSLPRVLEPILAQVLEL